ncbi:MAG: hypothetical protein A2161_21995, partial [Candidatus Schekmanbacteria bacterium RBG_13_48_7]
IDVGAFSSKVVLCDDDLKIVGTSVIKNRLNIIKASEEAVQKALDDAKINISEISKIVSTGYGRMNVEIADTSITEITCHGLGAYYLYPKAITVVDIGGQDNKIIQLNSTGKRISFKMNRKCAAGTGAFLDEIAARLELPVSELNNLAAQSTKNLAFGSYCTVFTSTEMLTMVNAGEKIEDIIRGVYISLANHVSAMAVIEGDVVMTGGVAAYNPVFVKIFEQQIKKTVSVHKYAHHAGALGAALYASEKFTELESKNENSL